MTTGSPVNVSTPCAAYASAVNAWTMVEDACAGSERIKAATVKYLPKPNVKDVSEENRGRYENYVMRAVYYNAVGRTLNGLVGIASRRDPQIQIPAPLEYCKDDCDGAGISLAHKGQQFLTSVLKTGRVGLLVDYPDVIDTTSVADAEQNGIRPTIALYDACDVINWRTKAINGKTVLSMIVLRESYPDDNEWVPNMKEQYRVLRLNDEQIYTTEVWRQQDDKPDEWVLYKKPKPVLMGNGRPWATIPFRFVGAKDNDDDIDPSPLYDLSVLNIAHYRNSADYEDSAYFTGQPQFWVSGLSEAWRDDMVEKGIYIGSKSLLMLPQNSACGVLQANPNMLARQAMQDKEAQMAALGARLLTSTGPAKTASQSNSEDAASHSVLTLCCNNVSAAMTMALGWFAQFANIEAGKDIEYTINTEFVTDSLDAPTLIALLQMVQAGKMPVSDLWSQLRDVGFIDPEKTDEEIQEEIDSQPVPGTGDAFGSSDPDAGGSDNASGSGNSGGAGSSNEPGTGLPGDGNGGNSEATNGSGVPRAAVGG